MKVSFVDSELSAKAIVRQPLCRLTGHTGVVISVAWLAGGDQLITASWDRTANIYDAERGEILSVLSGDIVFEFSYFFLCFISRLVFFFP